MSNFILIFICIGTGMLFRRFKMVAPNGHKPINTWLLYIAMPAVAFKYIPQIEWSTQMLIPAMATLIVWGGSWVFIELYCRYKKYHQRTRSTLELGTGYSNTGFIGFPLILAYYQPDDIKIAVICDQVMFLLLSSFGVIAAIKGSRTTDEKLSAGMLIKKILVFPTFLACFAAFSLSTFINFEPVAPLFDSLAATVAPLALFSVGLQLQFKGWQQYRQQLTAALLYKLVLAPLLVTVFVIIVGAKGNIAKISLFEAAMPTVISSTIIAEKYGLNSRLINLIIGVSIIIGLLTTACWSYIIHALGYS